MKRSNTIISLILASALVGCASKPAAPAAPAGPFLIVTEGPLATAHATPYKMNPELNTVDNVLSMLAIKPISALPGAKKNGDKSSLISDKTAASISAVSTTLSAPTGFSAGGAAAMGLLGMALASPSTPTVQSPYMFAYPIAFVPMSEATTPEAAIEYVKRGLTDYQHNLEAKNIAYPTTMTTSDKYLSFQADDPLMHNEAYSKNSLGTLYSFFAPKTRVFKGFAPAEVGGYPCYVVDLGAAGLGLFTGFGNSLQSDKSDIEILKARAKNTPTWLAFYLPSRAISRVVNGKREMMNVPGAIFNSQLSLYE